jgi:hypothetical protein
MASTDTQASSLPPPSSASAPAAHGFEHRGVSALFLRKFVKMYETKEMKTWEVKTKVVLPLTQERQCSMVQLMQGLPEKAEERDKYVGKANIFVSHAWLYDFADVVSVLVEHAKAKEKDAEWGGKPVFFWFDVFSVNQNNKENKAIHNSEWWRTTFKTAIKEVSGREWRK